VPYGYIGSMRVTRGHRDDVVAILLTSSAGLREAGCLSYIVGASTTDDDVIWVTEVWESAAHHAASLQLPETRAAIGRPMSMLTGEFTSQETNVLGGLGL
jgi:quinol monooxygenase YgiN